MGMTYHGFEVYQNMVEIWFIVCNGLRLKVENECDLILVAGYEIVMKGNMMNLYKSVILNQVVEFKCNLMNLNI